MSIVNETSPLRSCVEYAERVLTKEFERPNYAELRAVAMAARNSGALQVIPPDDKPKKSYVYQKTQKVKDAEAELAAHMAAHGNSAHHDVRHAIAERHGVHWNYLNYLYYRMLRKQEAAA